MKIGILGGAGVRTVIFINGLLPQCRDLQIDEVVLYDTDREKLAIIGKLCRYVVEREGGQACQEGAGLGTRQACQEGVKLRAGQANQEGTKLRAGQAGRHGAERDSKALCVRIAENPVEAIQGMDYIVTTLRVGGDHARAVDERLALRHGVIGQETTGVGGFFMAARTIPVLLDYMKLIREYAPDSVVFNFTNPSGMVTQALHDAGYRQVIGICDAPSSMKWRMARYLNVPEDDLYVEFFGLNHLSWIRRVEVRGGDVREESARSAEDCEASVQNWEAREAAARCAEDCEASVRSREAREADARCAENCGEDIRSEAMHGKDISRQLLRDDAFLSGIQELEAFDPQILRETGLLPNEYLYYYYHRERALANMLQAENLRGETIEKINRAMFDELRGMDIDADPEKALQTFLWGMQLRENSYMSVESGGQIRPLLEKGTLPIPEGMGYAGVMLDCIRGLQSEQERCLVLSVPNEGSLPFLRDEDIVEMTCRVSREGIFPVRQAQVPEFCEAYIRMIKRYERLAVQAIRENDRTKAVNALALHPLVNSWSLASALVEEGWPLGK